MSKRIFTILFMIIIANVYTSADSDCTKSASSASSRRLSTDLDCSSLETSDDSKKCIYSPSQQTCIEIDIGESECTSRKISRRLSASELFDDDCEPLTTSNDNKYICVASDDGHSCKEVEGSNGLKLSLTILCLLLFL